MRNKIYLIPLLLLFNSCKSFYLKTEKEVETDKTNQKIRFKEIDLSNYDLFVRQIGRKENENKFYCSNDPRRISPVDKSNIYLTKDSNIERLEIQYLFVEKGNVAQRKVIYISTIQPYIQGGEMAYNHSLFNSNDCININFFNLFKLGYANDSLSEIYFYNDCCNKSHWFINLKNDVVSITDVSFDQSQRHDELKKMSKVKIPLSNLSSIAPTFIKFNDDYKLILNNVIDSECKSNCSNNIVTKDGKKYIYYDEINKRMYFNFKDYVDERNTIKWIYFDGNRTMNYWVEY